MRHYKVLLATAAALAAGPLVGQPAPPAPPAPPPGYVPPPLGSSFAIVGQPVDPAAVLTAKSGGTLVKLDARPVSAVALKAAIPHLLAAQFGAKQDHPFDTARRLYGWPERPGLYCDLLRTRGLGLSTACLRDRELDGTFDEGLRLDFNSGKGDLLGITSGNKIIGVRWDPKPLPLPQPVAYAPAGTPEVTGKLALKWRKAKTRAGVETAELWVTTPDNYTGTEGLSEQLAMFPRANAPLELDFYGIRLKVLGFDEKGAMRYQVLSVADGATVPLRFRGYTFRILMI